MLFALIVGLAAGWFAPKAEPHVKTGLESFMSFDTPMSETELRLISFATCVLGAAVLAMLFGEPHAVVLAFGALVGTLGPRLQTLYRKTRNPDYDT